MLKVFIKLKRKFRVFWYKKLGAKIGKGVSIGDFVKICSPGNFYIGDNSVINDFVYIDARDIINIGKEVHLSAGCIVNTAELNYKLRMSQRTHNSRPVLIKDGAWIGSGAIINPGVTIGKNSVIGAGAVVTKSIPSNYVAVGIPAKIIKRITD